LVIGIPFFIIPSLFYVTWQWADEIFFVILLIVVSALALILIIKNSNPIVDSHQRSWVRVLQHLISFGLVILLILILSFISKRISLDIGLWILAFVMMILVEASGFWRTCVWLSSFFQKDWQRILVSLGLHLLPLTFGLIFLIFYLQPPPSSTWVSIYIIWGCLCFIRAFILAIFLWKVTTTAEIQPHEQEQDPQRHSPPSPQQQHSQQQQSPPQPQPQQSTINDQRQHILSSHESLTEATPLLQTSHSQTIN
jgi:hypothetical protein